MASLFRVGSAILQRSHGINSAGPWKSVWMRSVATTSSSLITPPPPAQTLPGETYFDKNKRLNRPMSPHLTIYKPQLTSMLSLSHRGTGIVLSTLLSSFSIGMLALPATYPYYISQLAECHYGAGIIVTAKFLVAFPFMFHLFNGIRHLTWDMGYGFSLRALYKSGYSVLALAIISSVLLVSY